MQTLQHEVCAVGWEPNPLHTAYLRELERSYRRCGYRVTIFTGTGVGVRRGNLTFASVDTVSHSQADNHYIWMVSRILSRILIFQCMWQVTSLQKRK